MCALMLDQAAACHAISTSTTVELSQLLADLAKLPECLLRVCLRTLTKLATVIPVQEPDAFIRLGAAPSANRAARAESLARVRVRDSARAGSRAGWVGVATSRICILSMAREGGG